MDNFRDLIKNAPTNFGVYNFIDKNSAIIYVGKARNLKNRLKSYLNTTNYRITVAVKNTVEVKWFICKNEASALLLENEQIKKYQPKYNILLKDDKTFPEIFISTNRDFPSIIYYRGNHTEKGDYFGPFPRIKHVKTVIDIIKKTTMIRGCSDNDFKNRIRPCLEYQIKRCTAPCVGYVSKSEYLEQIINAKLILEGKSGYVKEDFLKKLEKYSKENNFEKAKIIQSQIESLTYITNAVKSQKKPRDPLIKYLQEMYNNNKLFLDTIPRLGIKRKKLLLSHFGTIDAIKNASLNDIYSIKGIGMKIAKLIKFNN